MPTTQATNRDCGDSIDHTASLCRLKAAIFAASFGHFGSEAMLSKLAPRSCGISESTSVFLLYTLPVLPCCTVIESTRRMHCLGNCALVRDSAFGFPGPIFGPWCCTGSTACIPQFCHNIPHVHFHLFAQLLCLPAVHHSILKPDGLLLDLS